MKTNHRSGRNVAVPGWKTRFFAIVLLIGASIGLPGARATAQDQAKPNILVIMGDDIGYMQPGIYHRGLMVGETPNIDRIGQEGIMFTDYYGMQSCTSGRNAFFTGMYPLRTGASPAGARLRSVDIPKLPANWAVFLDVGLLETPPISLDPRLGQNRG